MTKKIEKKPVFEILFESGIYFAVCVASNKFINWEISTFSKDYFVIINKCDEERVKELTFYQAEGYKQVCERNLSPDEIEVFRRSKDKFVKTLHNEHGRVYELKGRSFKTAYDNINQKLRYRIMKSS